MIVETMTISKTIPAHPVTFGLIRFAANASTRSILGVLGRVRGAGGPGRSGPHLAAKLAPSLAANSEVAKPVFPRVIIDSLWPEGGQAVHPWPLAQNCFIAVELQFMEFGRAGTTWNTFLLVSFMENGMAVPVQSKKGRLPRPPSGYFVTGERTMRRIAVCLAVVAVIILGTSIAFSERGPEQGREGVLSVLTKGQAVSVTEAAGRYEIGIFQNGPAMLGYNVVEVGSDYVIVEDIAHVKELRIPIYSVKAVSILKAGRQGN